MNAILRVRACALGLASLLTTISISWAADQTITLKLGAGSPLVLERSFETVLIGDPNQRSYTQRSLGHSRAAESRCHKPCFR